jgi:hypothetical protein
LGFAPSACTVIRIAFALLQREIGSTIGAAATLVPDILNKRDGVYERIERTNSQPITARTGEAQPGPAVNLPLACIAWFEVG